MATLPSSLTVDDIYFPPSIKPPCTSNPLSLFGAGIRCLDVQGRNVRISSVALYMEDKGIQSLCDKWKGKTGKELMDSEEFCDDVANAPFEKSLRIAYLEPVPGKLFSETTSGIYTNFWKEKGTYTEADAADMDKYREAYKDISLNLGISNLLTSLPDGSVTINLMKDDIIGEAVISGLKNKNWGVAIIATVIGRNGVSPEVRQSVASRLSDFVK